MLDSVIEYITRAASTYAFIFCFCNLIIIIILVDLKPKLGFDQESEEIPLSMPTNTYTGIQGANSKSLINKNTFSPPSKEVAYAKEEEVVVDKVESEGNDNSICNSEEDDNDDELKRRVEEFIERVNEGWKAEHLSTSSLLWGEHSKELLD